MPRLRVKSWPKRFPKQAGYKEQRREARLDRDPTQPTCMHVTSSGVRQRHRGEHRRGTVTQTDTQQARREGCGPLRHRFSGRSAQLDR
jgi:site-specific DNA-cytosine methylase